MATHIEIDTGKLALPSPGKAGVRCFRGIPYAAPPVGLWRWKPPQPVAPWTGERPTDTFGPNAPQRVVFDDIDPFAVGVSEDCLYLNVWTPAEAPAKLPVLFWIHGGGFAVGSGSEPRYDGAKLAGHGIVVVTVNTRLNALGLLAHPALTEEEGSSGNYAMLDLVAALRWVKRNIASLGGDPDTVTIAGESAGSMFVSMLMASPLAKGLFHRAIGESGAQFPSPERPMKPLAEAHEQGLAFAAKLGAKTAADLHSLSVETILDANPGLGFWPIVDGYFMPKTLEAIFRAGEQADVPLIAGWTKDEGYNFNVLNWMKDVRFEDIVARLMPDHVEDVLRLYPGGSSAAQSARDLGGDLVIIHGTWRWLEAQRKTGKAPLFRYRFDRAPKTPRGWFPEGANAGAFHSCEILYVFDTLHAFPWLTDADDQKVADMTSRYWVNFVKTGDPNGNNLPSWPSYREGIRPLLIIDKETSTAFDLDRKRHELLARIVA
jgi:para-nitrobenzyl esterase